MAFPEEWPYYAPITISNGSADYQTKVTVYEGSGTNGNNVVYCGGKCKSDFSDLRFTGSNFVSLLDYWVESLSGVTPNQVAIVQVENDATPSTTGRMYYGNPAATAVSNGPNTFIFHDHFDVDLSKWTGDTAYASIASSICTVNGGGLAWRNLYGNVTAGSVTFAVRMRGNLAANESAIGSINGATQTHKAFHYRTADLSKILTRDGTTQAITASNGTLSAYAIWDIIVNGGTNVRFFETTERLGSPAPNPPNTSAMVACLSAWGTNALLCDWILLRKYAVTEPTFAFGSEVFVGQPFRSFYPSILAH